MRRSKTLLIGMLLSLLGGSAGACNLILGNQNPAGSTGGQGGDAGSPSTGSAQGDSGGQGGGGSGGSDAGGAPSSGGEGGAAGSGTGGSGETLTIPCGRNGRGEQEQIFVNGDWEDLGSCDDPDVCIDEETETDAPCAEDDRGTGERVCVSGSWSTTECVCNDDSEEYDALADACLVPIACDAAGEFFGGGLGIPGDPHVICTAEHLQNVQTALSASYVLATSLDLSDVLDFAPVGPFVGVFDGAGRALSGLALQGDGLFSTLGNQNGSPGTVQSLRLVDFEVSGPGALATRMENVDSLVEDVHVVGGSVMGGGYAAGGLIGNLGYGTVMGSSSSAAVSGEQHVGGLIGYVYGDYYGTTVEVADSWASGPVSGTAYVGGLIGRVYDVGDYTEGLTLTRGSASGTVQGIGTGVGGLIGAFGGTRGSHEVRESSASGSVTGGGEGAGGLIGLIYAGGGTYAVTQCFATGDVVGTTSVGGLIGRGSGTAPIAVTQSYAAGDVSGTNGGLGGLVGASPGDHVSAQESYAFGIVSFAGEGTAPPSVGAFYGEKLSGSGINFCVDRQQGGMPHVGTITNGSQPSVTMLAPASFASQTNFPPSWDFDTVWMISTEVARPILRWQLEE